MQVVLTAESRILVANDRVVATVRSAKNDVRARDLLLVHCSQKRQENVKSPLWVYLGVKRGALTFEASWSSGSTLSPTLIRMIQCFDGRYLHTPHHHVPNLNVSTNKHTYALTLNAVKTVTTFPLVRNFLRCSPSSPTSEKNCLFPRAHTLALHPLDAIPSPLPPSSKILHPIISTESERLHVPCCLLNALIPNMPAPYTANSAPML